MGLTDVRYRGTIGDRAVLRWFRPKPTSGETIDVFQAFRDVRKILILPNDRVGGLFIGAPCCNLLRQTYPQAQVDLFVDEKKVTIARQIPFVDRVVTGSLDAAVWTASFKQVADRLQQEQYDLCVCLGPDCSFRLAHLCGSSGARLRVGFQREGLEPFNVEVVQQSRDVYEGEQYRSMLRLFGIEGEPNFKWAIARDNAPKVRKRYLGEDHGNVQVVAVDLAGGEGDGLSVRQLDSLVGRIIDQGAVPVLFFSLADKKKVGYLSRTHGGRIRPFDQSDLPGVAALLEGCAALVSCNTELLHLGLALEIPVIAILEEDPRRWIASEHSLVKAIRVRELKQVDLGEIMQGVEAAIQARRGRTVAGPEI